MYPTLNHFFEDVFGFYFPLPVQTFGFFVAMAFFAAFWVFRAEFKRYERNGKIQPFTKTITIGEKAGVGDILVNFILGFVLGYKIGWLIIDFREFELDPRNALLSLQGNLILGSIAGAGFALWVYFDLKRKALPHPQKVEKIVHPYQLMVMITIAVGIAGVIGAKLFDVAEHWKNFEYDPLGTLFSSRGFAYYGGLLFGMAIYFYILCRRGMKFIHLADIGSPGMMLAYGIGRIGCHMAGDGDWGRINQHIRPGFLHWLPDWAWSYTYPNNAINAGVTIHGCYENYCSVLPVGVYPTSFYEAIICIGLFILMWIFRRRIIEPGAMFFIYLVLNGTERLLIEVIRINFKYNVLGLHLSQAQIIGLLMVIVGVAGSWRLLIMKKKFA